MKRLITILAIALISASAFAYQSVPPAVPDGVISALQEFSSEMYGTKNINAGVPEVYKTVTAGMELEKRLRYYGSMVSTLTDIKPAEGTEKDLKTQRWQRAYDYSVTAYKTLTFLKKAPGFNADAVHYTIYKVTATLGGKRENAYVAWDASAGKAVYVCIESGGIKWMQNYSQVPDDLSVMEFIKED